MEEIFETYGAAVNYINATPNYHKKQHGRYRALLGASGISGEEQ